MTSSQALTINMFGPLASDRKWLTRTIQFLFDRQDVEADGVRLEYAPSRRSQHLGDQTRVDVLVGLRSSHGPQALVFEVKYADRFNSRAVSVSTQRYETFAAASQLWNEGQVPASPAINQLVRVHALATSAVQSEEGPDARTGLVALLHDADVSGWAHVGEYAASLNDPQLCRGASHGTFLDAMLHASEDARQRGMVETLKVRYIEEHMSEDLWTEHRGKAPTWSGKGDSG